jgi:hypothetical protein
MMIRSLLVAATVLLVALPARAAHEHDAVTLTYLPSRGAVAACPEADYLANEVQVRLGYELFQPKGSKHLTVKIDRTSGGSRAVGEMVDDDGKVLFARTYPAMDCTFAVFSIAVGISIHYLEPAEPASSSPPQPTPTPSPVGAPPPEPVEPEPAELPPEPPPPVAAPVPERRRFQAGLASVFSIGTAPTVVGGVGGFLGVRWPSVSLALEGRALFAPAATLNQAKVRDGYHFTFAAISGSGCYHPAWTFVFLCTRVEIGVLSFGNMKLNLSPANMTILGLGFRLGAERTLTSWLALRAVVDAVGQPLSGVLKPDTGKPSLWSQTGLSGSIGLGPVFTF